MELDEVAVGVVDEGLPGDAVDPGRPPNTQAGGVQLGDDLVEILDLEREVRARGRVDLFDAEQVDLPAAGSEPGARDADVGSVELDQSEPVHVEAQRRVDVGDVDGDVVQADGRHLDSLPGPVDTVPGVGVWADSYRRAAVDALLPLEEPERADQMAAYMKDHFPFLGITAQPRRQAVRQGTSTLGAPPSEDELLRAAEICWEVDERELQYVGTDLLARHRGLLTGAALPRLRTLVETKSWWDTVDALASPTIGSVVQGDPELLEVMDRWVDDDDLWVARTAIIHQLRFKEATDADRLFDHCLRRAGDQDFFLRKAIGWALRQYARTAPAEVRAFVEAHRDELSPLSIREATKHL